MAGDDIVVIEDMPRIASSIMAEIVLLSNPANNTWLIFSTPTIVKVIDKIRIRTGPIIVLMIYAGVVK